MIVWGGLNDFGPFFLNTGGKYCAQPGAPSPTPTATPCASIGAWTEQSPYPIAVSGNAVASQGGNVYSFGGIANNTAIANAYKDTPGTNTWTPVSFLFRNRVAGSAPQATARLFTCLAVWTKTSTRRPHFGATTHSVTPITRACPLIPSLPTSTPLFISTARSTASAGGAIGTDFHVEVYDIATNTWSMAANYPFANHSLMAAALGGYIYAGGGNASPDKTYRYDPGTNTWDDAPNRLTACGSLGRSVRCLQRQVAGFRGRRELCH